jgi:hypothetical protein
MAETNAELKKHLESGRSESRKPAKVAACSYALWERLDRTDETPLVAAPRGGRLDVVRAA